MQTSAVILANLKMYISERNTAAQAFRVADAAHKARPSRATEKARESARVEARRTRDAYFDHIESKAWR